MSRRTPKQAINSVMELMVFVTALGMFLYSSPMSRPSERDQLAFELGYYRAACTDDGLRSNTSIVLTEIRRLSTSLGSPLSANDDRCPPEDFASQIRHRLSSQNDNSFVLGDNVAHLQLFRLMHSERDLRLLEHELPRMADAVFPASFGARDAAYALMSGTITVDAFYQRMYRAERGLRYLVSNDLDAARRAFALGFHGAACLVEAGSRRADDTAAEIWRLAASLSIPTSTGDADSHRCMTDDSLVDIADHLDWATSSFFHLGFVVSSYDIDRKAHLLATTNDRAGDMLKILDRLGFESGKSHLAGFLSGSLDADQLYQKLFDTSRVLTQLRQETGDTK